MNKIGGLLLLLIGVSGLAMGHQHHSDWNGREAPEIDLGSGANAVALISGSLLVLRSRKKG
jgi:hypothetical protein